MKKNIYILLCTAAILCGCEKSHEFDYKPEDKSGWIADFSYYDNNGMVEFENTSNTSRLMAYSWEFGDGDSYIKEGDGVYPEQISHKYSESGVYSVRMRVFDWKDSSYRLSCVKDITVRIR